MAGMTDMRRRHPEPPPGAPQIQFKPGLANEMLRELAPLLAEEGIDVDNIDVPDLETLQAAMNRAVERKNLALFTPVGHARDLAIAAKPVSLSATASTVSRRCCLATRVVLDRGSPVIERRRCAGSCPMACTSASRTASAVCRPSGRYSKMVNRLERSTRVPIAERLAAPVIKSPSQCPGTLRSSASAGRWLSIVIATNDPARRASARRRGLRRRLPVRSTFGRSRRSPPSSGR